MIMRLVALVALIVATAHGSPLTVRYERQPLEALGLQLVKVEKVIYTIEAADKAKTDVTLCINETLADDTGATVVIIDGNSQMDVPGAQTPEDKSCYKFTDVNFPKEKDLVKYELNIHKEGSRFGPLSNLEYIFHDVPKISTFDCNGKEYSRITYQSSGSDLAGQTCLNNSSICYLNGNFNISGAGKGSICLPSQNQFFKDDMVYCQPGSINQFDMGVHFSNYLSYDGFYAFSDDGKTVSATEALLLVNDKLTTVTAQDNNQVAIEGFTPSTQAYHVCSVQLNMAGGYIKGAFQSSVQDLDVHGGSMGGGLCAVSFVNENAKMTYSLNGGTSSSTAQSVSCERVGAGGPCFAQAECSDKSVMDLEYTGGVDNTIKIPQDKLTEQ